MCTVQEDADGAGGSLLSEVREPTGGAAGCDEIEGPDAVLQAAEEWVPTPVELDNARLHDSSSFDIITTLVDIYGDSLFVAEYKCASCCRTRGHAAQPLVWASGHVLPVF